MTKCLVRVQKSFDGLVRFWTRNYWKGEMWQDEEVDHFVSSYGSWPGHEANYTRLSRVLWHMGREGKGKGEKVRKDGKRESM